MTIKNFIKKLINVVKPKKKVTYRNKKISINFHNYFDY